ncbi:GRP family sugar transporter [Mucisphaera calidilacus]|uniref:Sugar transport protein n=1 Tax=Mucisphaera calidilacus TaxID=2527982 RepID=A0A518BWY6_9BACT|nr:GRP family sugar transporter [Mucisphaera calidilacus]QDU71488.1 Sugar transport protein [Mucisphaera calidilacus]
MEVWFWAAVTVISWGIWLAPLECAPSIDARVKTLMITLGNAGVSLALAASWGFAGLTWAVAWPSILGGMLWALSGCFAVLATERLGIAVAMGVWAPLNILTSLAWGGLFFGELTGMNGTRIALLCLAFVMMSGGIAMLVKGSSTDVDATETTAPQKHLPASGQTLGWLAVVLAGIGWGTYFVPVRAVDASLWVMAWPLSLGMLLGAALIWGGGLLWRGRPATNRKSPRPAQPVRIWVLGLAAVSGLLWASGNYGALNLMQGLGTGPGFAVAQCCLVVNAIVGMTLFGRPPRRSTGGRWVMVGVVVVAVGTALMGWVGSSS